MKRILHLLLPAIFGFFTQLINAQNPGDLDGTFGDGGKLFIYCDNNSQINDMEILDNGQIMLAGYCSDGYQSQGMIVLLNEDGSIDTNFGEDGYVYISFEDYEYTKIDDIEVYYPENKSAQTIEGMRTRVAVTSTSINELPHRSIVGLLDEIGQLVPSFGQDGYTEGFETSGDRGIRIRGVANNTSICVAGNFDFQSGSEQHQKFFLLAFDQNGFIRNDFGNNGVVELPGESGTDYIMTDLVLSPNRLIPVGYSFDGMYNEPVAAGVTYGGEIDNQFGVEGYYKGNYQNSIYITSGTISGDNSIFLGGSQLNINEGIYDKTYLKLTPDGLPDLTFGDGGLAHDSGDDADVEAMRKIMNRLVATGEIYTLGKSSGDWETTIFLTRYLEDGTVDESFGDNGDVSTDFGYGWNFAKVIKFYQDKIYVGGFASDGEKQNMALARYVNDINVSVDNLAENAVEVKIYPVPANKFVTVELTGNTKDNYSISIMNTLGQIVYSSDNIIGPEVKKLTLSTTELSPGLNTVRVENSENIITKKLIITE